MTGIQITWAGADGSLWDLSTGPVRLHTRPLEGFGDPEWARSTRSYAGMSGQRRTAPSTAKARSGFIPFYFAEKDAAARVVTSQAWWRSWDPDEPGIITATMPDGSSRFISACFDDDNSWAPSGDPYTHNTEQEGVSWIADGAWWRGPTQVQRFGQATLESFFTAGGSGPPFFISSSNALATATLSNPGDRPAAPRFTIVGPITAFDLAIDGHHLTGAFNIAAGQQLVLDAAVDALSADLIGTDGSITPVDTQLTAADYARVPKGASVPLAASLTGTGTLTVELDPLYRRAW